MLVVRFPQVVVPQKQAHKNFALEVHLFGQCLQIAPFSFLNSISYQVHPENFWCVPPKRSIPIIQLSAEYSPPDLSYEIRNPGLFFSLSEQQLLLEYLLFSTSRWVSSHHQHVEIGNDSHE